MIDELIKKVRAWWDEVYPEDIFTGVSGDVGAVRVAEIRDLLNEVENPEWLDNPNDTGWWWLNGENGLNCVEVKRFGDDPFLYWGLGWKCNKCKKAKWHKAYVPKRSE